MEHQRRSAPFISKGAAPRLGRFVPCTVEQVGQRVQGERKILGERGAIVTCNRSLTPFVKPCEYPSRRTMLLLAAAHPTTASMARWRIEQVTVTRCVSGDSHAIGVASGRYDGRPPDCSAGLYAIDLAHHAGSGREKTVRNNGANLVPEAACGMPRIWNREAEGTICARLLVRVAVSLGVLIAASSPLSGQDHNVGASGGSSAGNYSGIGGRSGSSNSVSTRSSPAATSSSRGSNSRYAGSRNTYGSSSTTYGASRNTYARSPSTSGPSRNSSSGGTSKRSSVSSTPRSRSHSAYGNSSLDYGSSRNSYGSNRNTFGTSRNTYGRGQRGSRRRGSSTVGRGQVPMEIDSNRDNRWARMYAGATVVPILAKGRIELPDGSAAANAVLSLNCGGGSYPIGHTGPRGHFSVVLNSCYPAITMATIRGGGGRIGAGGVFTPTCWLQVTALGYATRRLELQGFRGWGGPNVRVGTVALGLKTSATNPTVNINTLLAPEPAKRAYRKGLNALRKKQPNFQAASSHFAEAVSIHPTYAPAWAAMGEALMALGEVERAKRAFRAAIKHDPLLLTGYESLLQVATEEENWADVESLASAYIKISTTSSRVRFYRALAAIKLGKLDDAKAIVEKMKELGETERWTTAHWILALVHTHRTEFEQAAKEYEAFLARSPGHPLAMHARTTLYQWTRLEVIEPRAFPDGPPWKQTAAGNSWALPRQ